MSVTRGPLEAVEEYTVSHKAMRDVFEIESKRSEAPRLQGGELHSWMPCTGA